MIKSQGYRDQFERVKRFYEHFKQINDGELPMIRNYKYKIYDFDEILAFFIFCYHLKDWIKNDDAVLLPENIDVEGFINDNECLILCADICNGIKHLRRDEKHPPRSGEQPLIEGKTVELIQKGTETTRAGIKFSISHKGKTIDAFELATKCLETWEKFIEQNIKKSKA